MTAIAKGHAITIAAARPLVMIARAWRKSRVVIRAMEDAGQ